MAPERSPAGVVGIAGVVTGALERSPEGVVVAAARRPRYLGPEDLPWVDALLAVYRAHADARRAELDEALRFFLAGQRDVERVRRVTGVLDRLVRTKVRAPVDPRTIRARLFAAREAGAAREPRDACVVRVATALGLTPEELERSLFADFARERRVDPLPVELGGPELVSLANLALVQGLVARADLLRITVQSGARDLVRHARLVGLMHVVERPGEDGAGLVLAISGPFVLFRSTRLYARALASIVPRLAWCRDFELAAHLTVAAERSVVQVLAGDPIRPPRRPREHDSKLEARFAQDFAREAKDFALHREPAALEVGSHLVFPDFAIVHRVDPGLRALVEIVGFYTPEYLARKLALARDPRLAGLVLCIDATLALPAHELPNDGRIVWFEKRIRVAAVLAAVERVSRGARR